MPSTGTSMAGQQRVLEPLVGAMVCLTAVATAWVSQHYYDMQPCPWCVLQRVIFLAIAILALLQGVWLLVSRQRQASAPCAAWPLSAARSVLALSGVAAALWQHTVASVSTSCALTWPDRFLSVLQLDALFPDLFQPRASCLEAKAWILGVPYEFYSGALFAVLAAAALWNLREDRLMRNHERRPRDRA